MNRCLVFLLLVLLLLLLFRLSHSLPACGTFGPTQYYNTPTASAQTISTGTVFLGGALGINLYGCQPSSMFSNMQFSNQTTLFTYNDEGFIYIMTVLGGSVPSINTYVYNQSSIGPLILSNIQNETGNPVRQVTSYSYEDTLCTYYNILEHFSNGSIGLLLEETYSYTSAYLPDYVTENVGSGLGLPAFKDYQNYTINPQNGLISSIKNILTYPDAKSEWLFTYSSDTLFAGYSINSVAEGYSSSFTYNFTYDEQHRLSYISCVADEPVNSSCLYQFNYTTSGNISSVAIVGDTPFDEYCCTGDFFFDN